MSTAIAKQGGKVSLVEKMASKFNVEPEKMMATLKATAFKGDVSNEQMMALMIVADQYGLNPWTKEIYAFPDRHNGIIPVIGVDGWARIINENAQFDGMEFRQSETISTMDEAQPAPEWMECIIYRKDRSHPVIVREYLDEVYRPPLKHGMRGPWQTHTKRFLRHKTMIQCSRIAFGFVGVYDQDEAERIVESTGAVQVVSIVEEQKMPDYPETKFNENLSSWMDLIDSGERTPDQIIATVESRYVMTEEQKQKLHGGI